MSKRRYYGSFGDIFGKMVFKKSEVFDKLDRKSEFNEKFVRWSLFFGLSSDSLGWCVVFVWLREEIIVLVEYVVLYWEGVYSNGWLSYKDEKFWEVCVKVIVDVIDLLKWIGRVKSYIFF